MRSRYLSFLITCALVISGVASAQQKPSSPGADQLWNDLLAGNERYVAGKPAPKNFPARRTELADHQNPKVVVLGCADSREPPEILFDKNLGDLFVIRSAGNFADRNGIASIEYTVEHLGSTLLVILGHSQCGAVTAACSGSKMPTPNLQSLVDSIAPSCQKPSAGTDALELSVEKNVQRSGDDLLAHSAFLRDKVKEGKLTVIHAVYDLKTGRVKKLD